MVTPPRRASFGASLVPALAAAMVWILSCDRETEPTKVDRGPIVQQVGPALEILPYRFDDAERIVAIGDLHGDLVATRRVLRLAGAIDENDRWIGGNLVVVQVGDQLDRGDDERGILNLLLQLKAQAKAVGGALHVLNGNHEVMNVQGDYRYVTPAGFVAFADVTADGVDNTLLRRFVERARGRAAAFLPGGRYANQLAEQPTIIQLGRTVFVHGGVDPEHVDYGLSRINAEVRAFMQGKLRQLPALIEGPRSPVWMREYSVARPAPEHCQLLSRALELLGADRMIVGHTVQDDGVTAACDDKVWRTDIGLSAYYGNRTAEVLEIQRSVVRVLKQRRQERAKERVPTVGAVSQ